MAMTLDEARAALEALIFSSHRPISAADLAETLELERKVVESLIAQLVERYQAAQFGIGLFQVGGGYVFGTKPAHSLLVTKLHEPVVRSGLSQAALETLSVVAYRQPCTRLDIEMIRGVKVDSAVTSLVDRGLIVEIGRKEAPGRPILYGTTEKFLIHFGLNSLDELPELPEKSMLQMKEIAVTDEAAEE